MGYKIKRAKVELEVIIFDEGEILRDLLDDATYLIELRGTDAEVVHAMPTRIEWQDTAELPTEEAPHTE